MIQLSRMSAVFGTAEYLTTSAEVLASIPIQYILLPNGKVKHRRLLPGDRWLEVIVGLEDIPWRKVEVEASFLKPCANILPGGHKLPRILLDQIIAFFRHYMGPVVKTRTPPKGSRSATNHWGYGDDFEAAAHIIYNVNTKDIRVGIPTQVVSGGRVTFKHDHYDTAQGDVILIDFHSHNSMGAFFSSVDDASDEKAVFYSGVVGRLDCTEPEIVLRLNVGKNIKEEIDVEDLFEGATSVVFPEEWKGKVQKDTRATMYGLDGFDGFEGLGTWWADRERGWDSGSLTHGYNPGVNTVPPAKQFNPQGSLKKMLDRLDYGNHFTGRLLSNWVDINKDIGAKEGYRLSDDNDLRALVRSSLIAVRQYLDSRPEPADKEKFFEAKADLELFCFPKVDGKLNRWMWALCKNLASFDTDHEDRFTNRRLLGQLLFLIEVPKPQTTDTPAGGAKVPPVVPPASGTATPASLALVGKATGPDKGTTSPSAS